MKKTSLFLIISVVLLLCSCARLSTDTSKESLPQTDSEILRSGCFYLEAVQEYFGKSIVLKIDMTDYSGTVKICTEKKTDSYLYSEEGIFQLSDNGEKSDVTQTEQGQSLIFLLKELYKCPDAGTTAETNGTVFVFSQDGKKLTALGGTDNPAAVIKIEHKGHTQEPET